MFESSPEIKIQKRKEFKEAIDRFNALEWSIC